MNIQRQNLNNSRYNSERVFDTDGVNTVSVPGETTVGPAAPPVLYAAKADVVRNVVEPAPAGDTVGHREACRRRRWRTAQRPTCSSSALWSPAAPQSSRPPTPSDAARLECETCATRWADDRGPGACSRTLKENT